jgi:phosphopantothenoylcysteine synthetase/decarboxylase
MGDPVSHIALRDWADLLVIAPCSAHSLAKFVHGLCDDLLSSIVRAWPFPNNDHPPPSNKPMILVPAMNTGMWEHPLTRQQLETMQRHWATTNTTITDESTSIVTVVPPQSKLLACGESGMGAMAPIPDIVRTIQMTWKQTVVRKDDDRLDSDLKSKQKFTYQGA